MEIVPKFVKQVPNQTDIDVPFEMVTTNQFEIPPYSTENIGVTFKGSNLYGMDSEDSNPNTEYLINHTANYSEATAKYIGEWTKDWNACFSGNFANQWKCIVTIRVDSGKTAKPALKVQLLVNGQVKSMDTFTASSTYTNGSFTLYFPTVTQYLTRDDIDNMTFKFYAWSQGTGYDDYYVGFGVSYWNKCMFYSGQFRLNKGPLQRFDILVGNYKEIVHKFDVLTSPSKSWVHKFDVLGTQISSDYDYTIYVNGSSVDKSLFNNLKISVVAYTPEARTKPYISVSFSSPNSYNLGDSVKIVTTYCTYYGQIVNKEKSEYSTQYAIYNYQVFAPYQDRQRIDETYKTLLKSYADWNFILTAGLQSNAVTSILFAVPNSALPVGNFSTDMIIPSKSKTSITNVNAPDLVYGWWTSNDYYPWYGMGELNSTVFDEVSPGWTQRLTSNIRFDYTREYNTVELVYPGSGSGVSFIRYLNKPAYAKSFYFQCMLCPNPSMGESLIKKVGTGYAQIIFEGQDITGTRQTAYTTLAISTNDPMHWIISPSGQAWISLAAFFTDYHYAVFSSDPNFDFWINKIQVTFTPVAENLVVDYFNIGATGKIKEYEGTYSSNCITKTVDLSAHDYDGAKHELKGLFTRLQCEKGYSLSIPLNLSFYPPLFISFEGELLKIYKVEHDIDNGVTSLEAGTGLPQLTSEE